ncbi:hypothetical protein GCM10022221_78340 [Actinocorallia aurea]
MRPRSPGAGIGDELTRHGRIPFTDAADESERRWTARGGALRNGPRHGGKAVGEGRGNSGRRGRIAEKGWAEWESGTQGTLIRVPKAVNHLCPDMSHR